MRYLFMLSVIVMMISLPWLNSARQEYDYIIRNGTICDGSGSEPYIADIAFKDDTIAALGNLNMHKGKKEIDAKGLVVAPGFINMLSWADLSLVRDGYSISDIKQGVTLEVLGEGLSPGPNRRTRKPKTDGMWSSLGEFFEHLEREGVSPNVASFVGATSVRIHEMEFTDRPPDAGQLERMKRLVAEAMLEGAMGLSTSLIYPPATYATTDELIALAKIVSTYDGMYITHMRSESDFILPAINETIRISKEAGIPAEIYHLKVNIGRNWNKIDAVLGKIDSARNAGIKLTANMYPYTASATGLTSRLPSWIQEGGAVAMRKRILKPAVRKKVLYEMEKGIPSKNSDPDKVVLMHFRLESLNKLYKGKTLTEAAAIHGKNVDETTIDLIVKDKSRIETLYFLQSEDIVRRIIQKSYVSFGSDGGSYSLTDPKERLADHPRAFGTFARILGKYVREEQLITLQEAVRKLTSLPASNLKITKRGNLSPGYFADVVVFDPLNINDLATFENPHQYAQGMVHVFVNGVQVLDDGRHTQAKPGRIIHGPGWRNKKNY